MVRLVPGQQPLGHADHLQEHHLLPGWVLVRRGKVPGTIAEWPTASFKGVVPRDCQIQVFSYISFSQAPEYTISAISIFSKIRGAIRSPRCTTSVVDTGANVKKSSIRNVFIILFGYLWVVELTYR